MIFDMTTIDCTTSAKQVFILVVLLALAACNGCRRGGPERVVVSGTASYRDEPIPSGTIRFIPQQGQQLPSAVARILDGRYSANANGGVCVGTYRIEIVAHRTDPRYRTAATSHEAEAELPTEQYLPNKYNTQTQLEIAIEAGRRVLKRDFALVD